jgi:hypothetical protein
MDGKSRRLSKYLLEQILGIDIGRPSHPEVMRDDTENEWVKSTMRKKKKCVDGRIICAAEGGTSRREASVLLGRLAVRFIDDLSEGLKEYGIRSRRITQENAINL